MNDPYLSRKRAYQFRLIRKRLNPISVREGQLDDSCRVDSRLGLGVGMCWPFTFSRVSCLAWLELETVWVEIEFDLALVAAAGLDDLSILSFGSWTVMLRSKLDHSRGGVGLIESVWNRDQILKWIKINVTESSRMGRSLCVPKSALQFGWKESGFKSKLLFCLSGQEMVPTGQRPLLKDSWRQNWRLWEQQLVDPPIAYITES